jgi:glucose-6-phosphate 1-epimerase
MSPPPSGRGPTPASSADPHTVPGVGGLPKIVVQAPDGARAELYLHGAHVTSWMPPGAGGERLFLSAASGFRADAAIRGGVPVIFPQFAGRGPLPRHGFARTAEWTPVGVERRERDVRVTLRLADSEGTRAIWPHAFVAELTVTVGGPSLRIALSVANHDTTPFDFTAALHTYLRVADVRRTTIAGLGGARYEDSAAGGAAQPAAEDELHVAGETDRVYLGVSRELEVREDGRVTAVGASGFPDVVVWNPGPERGAALADLEPEGWLRMLCVEAAVVGTPVHLGPFERWEGVQTLTAAR